MKSFKIICMALVAILIGYTTHAQSNKSERHIGTETASIKVYGNCGMDKKRIEKNALSVTGVKSAVWNEDTELLTLQYSVSKPNAADEAQKKVAAAGNDTEKYRADDAVYNSLPDCCHYKRKKS